MFPVTYVVSCNVNKSLVNIIIVCNENINIRSKLQQAKSTGASDVVLITTRLLAEQDTVKCQFPIAFICSKKREAIKNYASNNKNNAAVKMEFHGKIATRSLIGKNSIRRTEREETKP